jgi:molecular chaperone GrpE
MPSSRVSEEQQAQEQEEPRHSREEQEPGTGEQQPPPSGDGHAEELARAEDRYKRALADLDNYRKRSQRELDRRTTEATDALIRDWLEVVDSVDRALRMEADGPLVAGMRAVLEQIESVLAREGVQRTGMPGERFDPERHEAISVQESPDAEDRTIVDVARSGFMRGDRVLRPAQVVVSRRPEPAGG